MSLYENTGIFTVLWSTVKYEPRCSDGSVQFAPVAADSLEMNKVKPTC